MSGGHFLKHLASTLSSRSLSFTTLSRPLTHPFSSRFFTSRKPTELSRPNSPLTAANISTSSSSSETPSAQPFALPFQSVNIRCQRHVSDMLQEALLCFGASSTSIDEDDNHEDSDEESFHPVEITEGLWIVPEWKTPPDSQATNIILNPGLAFGTGEHPTTRLCILLLHGLIKGGEQFVDYGTGSGILAIAAVKGRATSHSIARVLGGANGKVDCYISDGFGAAFSVGIDIDPQAITSARQNATLNNIGPEQMQLHLVPSETCRPWTDPCEGVEERSSSGVETISQTDKYDVLIANILLNPLLDLADQIVSYAKPGGVIGLSGILSEQLPYIIERYSQFLKGISTTEVDGWACAMAERSKTLLATEKSLPSKLILNGLVTFTSYELASFNNSKRERGHEHSAYLSPTAAASYLLM